MLNDHDGETILEPADERFCRVIALVRCAVEDRNEAALAGGRYAEALARLAEGNSRKAGEMITIAVEAGALATGLTTERGDNPMVRRCADLN